MSVGGWDGILLASYGGPEGQDEVIPFLRNVTNGRGIPDERLEEVAHHYRVNGGISPITGQNRALKAALEAELERRGIDLPIWFGNRNWGPYFTDAIREADEAGATRILALVTAAYTSYSGVGQYLEDFDRALIETGTAGRIEVHKLREFFDHPGFVGPFVEGVAAAAARLAERGVPATDVHLQFVTHSIPVKDAVESGPGFGEGGAYVAQHRAVARVIAEQAMPGTDWSLVYQSRSGAPHTPWLEPDINEALAERAEAGYRGVIIVPIGFISDHMEVAWDLDTEAIETAAEFGLHVERVPTPGTHPAFVAGLVDLIEERLHDVDVAERPHLTELGPWADLPPRTGVAALHGSAGRP